MDAIIKDLGLLINATLIATPPLLLAALGSCFTERSGTVNIGIEGMMTIGAFTGAVVGLETGNGWQIRQLHPGDKPAAEFALTPEDEIVAVYAYCNIHGLWRA